MNIAFQEACIAFHKNEIPIGAVMIHNNFVIAKAHNLTEKSKNITAHAEIIVLNLASHYLEKKYMTECTLYVTIEPCVMCAGALFLSRMGRLVYGASNHSNLGFLGYGIRLHPKTTFSSGIMEQQCKLLMKKFFLSIRRKKKKIK